MVVRLLLSASSSASSSSIVPIYAKVDHPIAARDDIVGRPMAPRESLLRAT
jgi:hypothetical protein